MTELYSRCNPEFKFVKKLKHFGLLLKPTLPGHEEVDKIADNYIFHIGDILTSSSDTASPKYVIGYVDLFY